MQNSRLARRSEGARRIGRVPRKGPVAPSSRRRRLEAFNYTDASRNLSGWLTGAWSALKVSGIQPLQARTERVCKRPGLTLCSQIKRFSTGPRLLTDWRAEWGACCGHDAPPCLFRRSLISTAVPGSVQSLCQLSIKKVFAGLGTLLSGVMCTSARRIALPWSMPSLPIMSSSSPSNPTCTCY